MSRGLAIFLAIMAGLFILIANFSIWLGASIFNEETFTKTTVTVLRTRPVRDAVSAEIVSKVEREVPEIRGPVAGALEDVISSFLASSAARPILEALADDVNQSFTSQGPQAVRLDLRDIIRQLQPLITRINTEFDVNITTDEVPKTITVVQKNEMPSMSGWVPFLWLGPLLGIFGLALIVGSVIGAGPARAMVLRVNGIVLAVSALLFLILLQFASAPLSTIARNGNARVITVRLFEAFSTRLSMQTWLLFAAAVLLAAAGFILPGPAAKPRAEEPKRRAA